MDIITEIKTHFKQVLERDLDESGMEHFVNLMKNGKMTLEDIKNAITSSPEAINKKTSKFIRDMPKFQSNFSESEVRKMLESVTSWYHYFKIGNVATQETRTTLGYQMWVAQGIPLDLKGKKVLDIGAADGFYSFLCEARGAERVLAVDFLEFDGFKVMKKILASNVEHRKMNVLDIDKLDEKFDIILFFGVYYHLANPVLALQKIFSQANKDVFLAGHIIDRQEPIMCYYDEYEMHPADGSNWWVASPSCINKIAKRIGFKQADLLDDLNFENSYQSDEIKNSIRKINKVGVFKLSK